MDDSLSIQAPDEKKEAEMVIDLDPPPGGLEFSRAVSLERREGRPCDGKLAPLRCVAV